MPATKAIPDGMHAVTPHLVCAGAADAIEFYKKAFGATEVMRMEAPGGKIGHAELQIGDSRVMLADEFAEMGFLSPKSIGGTAVMMHLYVEDVDATFPKAVAAGAMVTRPLKDEFYGDRAGQVEDPFGHKWHVSTHKEDLTIEEIDKRREAAFATS
jgi:PhnB protein